MKSRFLISILAFFLILAAGFLMTTFLEPNIPKQEAFRCEDCNILLFTIDTLRADHLSSYGYFQKTTPNMDNLANEGVTFVNAFSQIPHTPPSHWSIFTGLYAYKHGRFSPGDNGSGLITLPAILKKKGYVTSGFISSKMLGGFNEEFDYFNGYSDRRRYKSFIMRKAEETTDAVLSWLGKHSSEKFFLWVHYFDPHSPYDPPEEFDLYNYEHHPFYFDTRYDYTGLSRKGTIRQDIAKYDGEVRYTDENVGKVLDELKKLGVDKNTLVILLSDHGECFGEHNFSDFGYNDNKPCLFHGKTLYDQEIHVPLIIRNPKSTARGFRIDKVVETVDIFPTVLDMLNITSERKTDGESLVPLIEGKGRVKNYTISQTKPKNSLFSIAIRTEEWKFVLARVSDFDIQEDVREQEEGLVSNKGGNGGETFSKKLLLKVNEHEEKNMLDSEGELAERLEEKLKEIITGFEIPETVKTDRDTEDLLKSLGYMT